MTQIFLTYQTESLLLKTRITYRTLLAISEPTVHTSEMTGGSENRWVNSMPLMSQRDHGTGSNLASTLHFEDKYEPN